MRKWEKDDIWQKRVRNLLIAPFYEQTSYKGRFTFLDKSKGSMCYQKNGVDTAFQVTSNASTLREEKLVRWPGREYSAFFIETDSCTLPGLESKGWAHYSIADELAYGLVQSDERSVHLYMVKEFPNVLQWFWEMYEMRKYSEELKKRYREHTMQTENRTRGLIVPIGDIIQIAKTEYFEIWATPTGCDFVQRDPPILIKRPLPVLKPILSIGTTFKPIGLTLEERIIIEDTARKKSLQLQW